MIKKDQFLEIKKCKEESLRRNQAAKRLGLHFNTVDKFWNMSVEEYDTMIATKEANRGIGKKAQMYHEPLVELITESPHTNTAQLISHLKDYYGVERLDASDRTIYKYVNWLRKQLDLNNAESTSSGGNH